MSTRTATLLAEAPAVRTRTRPAAPLKASAPKKMASRITDGMEALAVKVYQANLAANAAAGAYRKAHAELHALMLENEVEGFVTEADGKVLDVNIAAPEKEYIDVAKLRELVTDKQFMEIVKATKGEVTAVAGTNVTLQATRTRKGEPSLYVKARK